MKEYVCLDCGVTITGPSYPKLHTCRPEQELDRRGKIIARKLQLMLKRAIKAEDLIHHADNKHAELQAEIERYEEIETDLNNTIGFMERGITEWKEKCEGLETEQEWVSVENRLPEDQQEEVLWFRAGFPVRWEDSEFYYESSAGYTHWMPIPTLPEPKNFMDTIKPTIFLPECIYQEVPEKGWVKCKKKIGKKPDGVYCDKRCDHPEKGGE